MIILMLHNFAITYLFSGYLAFENTLQTSVQ